MLFTMRMRSAPWRRIAAFVLPLAVFAALPAVRWCALDWQSGPACFDGLAFDPVAMDAAAAALPHAALEHPVRTANAGDVQHPARTSPGAAQPMCAAGGCPAARAADCPLTACRLESERAAAHASTRVPIPRAPAAPHRARHGRAFCVTDPNGGTALRPHPPQLRAHTVLPAIIVWGDACVCPAQEIRRLPPQLAARPPTRSHDRLPPVRGPPRV